MVDNERIEDFFRRVAMLQDRDLRVYRLLLHELTDANIMRRLRLSAKSVQESRQRILKHVEAQSISELKELNSQTDARRAGIVRRPFAKKSLR
jgi:FixJ family two-component response regulator